MYPLRPLCVNGFTLALAKSKAGDDKKMNAVPNVYELPPELEDASARVDQANRDYVAFAHEMNEFLYRYVKGMLKGFDPDTGHFIMQLRHPKCRNVKGRPAVLIAQIAENLRSALDYMVFQLSVLNDPNLKEHEPQFVIAHSAKDFERQAKRRLRYLSGEQKSFIEGIQPYHGNGTLGLLGEIGGPSKHRRLLSVRDNTGLDIYFAEMTKKDEFPGFFVYPCEKESAVFAKPKAEQVVVLLEKYYAMPTLERLITQTIQIIRASYCFFQGRPFELTIVKA